MIGVKKISHATYETPDLDQQIEYYTDVLGLTLVAKEKDAAYLASTLDHHIARCHNLLHLLFVGFKENIHTLG